MRTGNILEQNFDMVLSPGEHALSVFAHMRGAGSDSDSGDEHEEEQRVSIARKQVINFFDGSKTCKNDYVHTSDTLADI